MTTTLQTNFNADIDAIMAPAFYDSWISAAGNGTAFEAQFTLLRTNPAEGYPVGDNSLIEAELRWQQSDFANPGTEHVFKRVDTGDYWEIPKGLNPEVDGFGEVIATIRKIKKNTIGAV